MMGVIAYVYICIRMQSGPGQRTLNNVCSPANYLPNGRYQDSNVSVYT